MFSELGKTLKGYRLTNPEFRFLLEEDRTSEVVSLHCKASSFDPARAELRSVCALRIRGQRILTSQRLVLTFAPGDAIGPGLEQLLHFIRSRPLVGYYLDFSVAMIDKYLQPRIGLPLPNPRIEVSSLYYDQKLRVFSDKKVDLRLNSILRDLDLPDRGPADAFSDALTQALIYLKLKGLDHG